MKRPTRNLERKFRCPDLDAARSVAARLGAARAGTFRQVDTYFRVPAGRLKLRVSVPGEAELIAYRRPDDPGMRASDYLRTPVDDPDSLRDALALVPGVRVTVRKTREVWLRDNVRIHLDDVDGLGTFVEYEVIVDADHPERTASDQAAELDRAFAVTDSVPGSYADLLDKG